MAGRALDAGRERLRTPAFQRRRERGLHSFGVQGEAAVSVHAPAFPKNGGMANRQAAARPRRFQTADGHLSGEKICRSKTNKPRCPAPPPAPFSPTISWLPKNFAPNMRRVRT